MISTFNAHTENVGKAAWEFYTYVNEGFLIKGSLLEKAACQCLHCRLDHNNSIYKYEKELHNATLFLEKPFGQCPIWD